MTKEQVKAILQEDDASDYLKRLSEAERRPQYIQNGLKASPRTFTQEEQEAAAAVFTPKPGETTEG